MQRKFRVLSDLLKKKWRALPQGRRNNLIFLIVGASAVTALTGIKQRTATPPPGYTFIEKSGHRPSTPRFPIDSIQLSFLSYNCCLATSPITNEQFYYFVASTGFGTWRERHGFGQNWRYPEGASAPSYILHPKEPVVFLTQADAQAFCRWLSTQIHLPCRLPTLAELEASPLEGNLWEWSSGTLADVDQTPGATRYPTAYKQGQLLHRRASDAPKATFRVAWDL